VAEELKVGWMAETGSALPLAAEERAGYESHTPPVKDLGEVISRVRAHADELQISFGVVSIAVFGSFARGEQHDESDVDPAVEVEHPSLENVFGAEQKLAEILGRHVQAGSIRGINPQVRPRVEEDLVCVWTRELAE
jgi:predicted nucleotidyltransferase